MIWTKHKSTYTYCKSKTGNVFWVSFKTHLSKRPLMSYDRQLTLADDGNWKLSKPRCRVVSKGILRQYGVSQIKVSDYLSFRYEILSGTMPDSIPFTMEAKFIGSLNKCYTTHSHAKNLFSRGKAISLDYYLSLIIQISIHDWLSMRLSHETCRDH